ncbi:MAG: hypothetical protein JWN32_496 [Solirubrobacterales bacterium]|nr:hypothetical protein [Solirubrobacterales bacterium]
MGLLAEARRQGYTFDEAWHLVVAGGGRSVLTNDRRPPALALRWPTDRTQRLDTQRAILDNACREAFRRSYDREPMTEGDRAVVILHDMLTDAEGAPPRRDIRRWEPGRDEARRAAPPAAAPVTVGDGGSRCAATVVNR